MQGSEDSWMDPDKLGRLLDLYTDQDPEDVTDADREKTWVLRDYLSYLLPLNQATLKSLPTILRRLLEEMPRAEGKSLGTLLQYPHVTPNDLRAVKEYAKLIGEEAKTKTESEVAGAIYYAAIAAALSSHDQKMTEHSYAQLRRSFSLLGDKKWIVADLRQLFEKAERICAEKSESGDP
jgi:hypothetical protein